MDGIPFDNQPAARIPEMDPHPVPGPFRTVKLGSIAQEFLPVNVPCASSASRSPIGFLSFGWMSYRMPASEAEASQTCRSVPAHFA